MPVRYFLAGATLVAMTSPALAHQDHHGTASGFAGGFAHPLLGIDHMAAMVAIGLWAAALGGKAVWRIPASFILAMIGGFVLAVAGVPLPAVEPGIAASVLVLGLLIAAAVRLPLAGSIGLAGLFALFHGHAHGTEMSGNAVAFGLGFVAATILLHASGLWIGRMLVHHRPILARGVGAAVGGVGVLLIGGLA